MPDTSKPANSKPATTKQETPALDVTGDARTAVEHIVYGYAERIDVGDLAGVAELFADARYKGGGPDDPGVQGAAPVQQILETMVRRYDDGTPRTKHVTTNLIIDADDDGGTATSRCYYTVFQQVDDTPLQPIIAGRYHDTFARVDGRWRLTERVIFCDLVGDLSRHLTVDPFAG